MATLRVQDADALKAMVEFGAMHRAAIADHCLGAFSATTNPADRLSLGAEVVVCLIGAVEDLEMLYYSLCEKRQRPRVALYSTYSELYVREPPAKERQATDKSAHNMLRQLRAMNLSEFRDALDLPTFEEWLTLGRAPGEWGRARKRKQFHNELRGLRRRMIQAVSNRSVRRLMRVYNKLKHGFVVLPSYPDSRLLLVERAKSIGKHTSSVQLLPFEVTERSIATLAQNVKNLAVSVRALLHLYTRTGTLPPSGSDVPVA